LKLDVVMDGRAARLETNGTLLRYERSGVNNESPDAIEREFSVVPLAPGSYSVLIGERSYTVFATSGEVVVNGRTFAVEIFDPREMRGRKSAGVAEGRQKIAATMPGKVVRLLVNEGDTVEAGQGLVVVEAMKMQNEMKSPKAGRVVEVKTKADATVAAGEVLLVIE
jgi:biotin carboxyl carrier protein